MRRLFQPKVLAVILLIVAAWYGYRWLREGVRMSAKSYTGKLDPLDPYQEKIRDNLTTHVEALAGQIGERNMQHLDSLNRAADYIRQTLEQREYVVLEDTYEVQGKKARIIYAALAGAKSTTEPFVVGAHYDSVEGTVGANDNGSGVAAVLELSRILKSETLGKTIVFAFFPNEEPPYFQTNDMGSLVFVKGFHRDYVRFSGMISVETIGYYSDRPGSQNYPSAISSFYPDTGNFIGFVGDIKSRALLKASVAEFRRTTHFPSEGASLPGWIQGVGWSDHWSFWQVGTPAIMVTDTAVFRYPYYHKREDTPDKLDYDRMARVVLGLKRVIQKVAE
jgi:hypothetical protein